MYYDTEGVALGLKITSTGYKKHISERINKAGNELRKLYRFRDLSSNKRKLYLPIVIPTLTCPSIPLCNILKTQMCSLQRIQNKVLRWINNTKWYDFTPSEELHPATISCRSIYSSNTARRLFGILYDTYTTKTSSTHSPPRK